MTHARTPALSLACAGALAATASAQLANGSFELGSGIDADNWNELNIFGGSQGALASAQRTQGDAFDGNWKISFNVTGAPDFGPVAEIQQLLSAGSVIGGETYNFSFWSKGIAGPGAVAFYEVLWFDADGSNGGGPQGTASGLEVINITTDYAQTSLTGVIAPTTADSALVQIRLVTGAFTGASGSLDVDAVSFTLVPAPAVAGLAGLAGIAAGRRRR